MNTDEERESEEIDVEIYEGDPDFKSSGVLNDDGQQDEDADEAPKVETDLGQALGNGPVIGSGLDENQTPPAQDGAPDA